jgi:hypothetical protein
MGLHNEDANYLVKLHYNILKKSLIFQLSSPKE